MVSFFCMVLIKIPMVFHCPPTLYTVIGIELIIRTLGLVIQSFSMYFNSTGVDWAPVCQALSSVLRT